MLNTALILIVGVNWPLQKDHRPCHVVASCTHLLITSISIITVRIHDWFACRCRYNFADSGRLLITYIPRVVIGDSTVC